MPSRRHPDRAVEPIPPPDPHTELEKCVDDLHALAADAPRLLANAADRRRTAAVLAVGSMFLAVTAVFWYLQLDEIDLDESEDGSSSSGSEDDEPPRPTKKSKRDASKKRKREEDAPVAEVRATRRRRITREAASTPTSAPKRKSISKKQGSSSRRQARE